MKYEPLQLFTGFFFHLIIIIYPVFSHKDEGSDKEASVESETEKSTEDEESSESETVSGSASESEEVKHVFGAWNVVMD